MLLAWGRSHRTAADGELVRWGQELARVEARVGRPTRRPRTATRSRSRWSGRPPAAPASGSASTASRAGRAAARRASCGRSCSRPRRCCSSPARRRSGARPSTGSPASDRRPTPATSRPTAGRSSSATACCGSIREEQATRAELRVLGPDAARVGRRRSARSATGCSTRWPSPWPPPTREIAPDEAAAERLRLDLRDQRPAAARRVGARRARPAARRDGREGGLERDDADRAAPRRPRVRDGRPAARLVRVARPAADRDPRVQARRARPPDGARRPAPAAAPRRRVLASSTRSGAPTSCAGSRPCRRRS